MSVLNNYSEYSCFASSSGVKSSSMSKSYNVAAGALSVHIITRFTLNVTALTHEQGAAAGLFCLLQHQSALCVCVCIYIYIYNSCPFCFGCLPSFPACRCLVAFTLVTAHVATGRDVIHAMQSLWWNENARKKALASLQFLSCTLQFLSCTTPSLSGYHPDTTTLVDWA